jgi:hypothetical protein
VVKIGYADLMIGNKATVYEYAIVLGAREKAKRFTWLVDVEDQRRVPVLVDDAGVARLIGTDEDQLTFLDLLDDIMEARRRGLWPRGGLCENLATKYKRAVALGSGWYGPSQWSTIAFSDWDISHDFYQKCLDEKRRAITARRK